MPRHSGEKSFSVCRGRFAFWKTRKLSSRIALAALLLSLLSQTSPAFVVRFGYRSALSSHGRYTGSLVVYTDDSATRCKIAFSKPRTSIRSRRPRVAHGAVQSRGRGAAHISLGPVDGDVELALVRKALHLLIPSIDTSMRAAAARGPQARRRCGALLLEREGKRRGPVRSC